ncbi:hypothetical protein DWY21_04585 [Phocaeicola plebeius]|uniref:Uncharacterized protein n=1 Tax=Phocaeicola plebeius TaxID=310297 RepID=A0A412H7S1_9BACT|nr:hypothetical protein DWY21_04585 [Phocaeicola plebeius]RGS08740.1 hypothetical protein DWY14_05085 [Phocaeicola plebeius]
MKPFLSFFQVIFRLLENAFAFKVKRPCVLLQMYLCLKSNALAFFSREKVFLLKNLAVKKLPHPNG